MPYSNTVDLLYVRGEDPLPIRIAHLWDFYETFVENNPGHTAHEAWVERASVTGGALSFNLGPAHENRRIGLSIKETGWEGPLFRSGMWDTLPSAEAGDPAGGVSIFVPEASRVSEADVQTMFRQSPSVRRHSGGVPQGGLPVEPMVTDVRLLLGQDVLTITATYQAAAIPPTEHARRFTMTPSSEMRFSRYLTEWQAETATGVDAAGASATISFAMHDLQTSIARFVEGNAIAAMARYTDPTPANIPRALPDVTPLPNPASLFPPPPIVSMSLRRVVITPAGIALFPALGAFGSIPQKLFPGWSPEPASGGTCALTQSVVLSAATLNLELLRSFRNQLATDALGQRCIDLYYTHGAEVAQIVDTHTKLGRAAVATVHELLRSLDHRLSPSRTLLRRGMLLLNRIAVHGSPALRRDIVELSRDARLVP